jgi:hypothetical protein
MLFTIAKSVPIPVVRRSDAVRRKYPFEAMEVGDMFFVPFKTKNTLHTHASNVGRETGKKFATRMTQMRPTEAGGWTPTKIKDPEAVRGIGVWRTK